MVQIIDKDDMLLQGQHPIKSDYHIPVIGLDRIKEKLRKRFIDHFVYKKQKIMDGITPSKGMILAGPPGVGKTMLIKEVIEDIFKKNKRYISYYVVHQHDVIGSNVGDTSRKIYDMFNRIKEDAKKYDREQIIIIDEIELIIFNRSKSSSVKTKERTVALSEQFGGIEDKNPNISIYILGTTNRPWDIDPAFLRSGRFDDFEYIYPPTRSERLQGFEQYFKGVKLTDRHCLIRAADISAGYTHADINSLADKVYDRSQIKPLTPEELISYIENDHVTFKKRMEQIENFQIAMRKFGFEEFQYKNRISI